MSYGLAKKLKDAGWPQPKLTDQPLAGWYLYEKNPIDKAYISIEDFGEMAYYPTLSELIEACGDVILWKHISGVWRADLFTDKYDGYIDESFDPSEGPTPEEAVVNLWLKLNS